MVEVNAYRKRILQAYDNLLLVMNPFLENPLDFADSKDRIEEEIKKLEGELVSFRSVVEGNKELRSGNVLNALMESEFLIHQEKGVLKRMESLLKEELNDEVLARFQNESVELKNRQSNFLKFLESEKNS